MLMIIVIAAIISATLSPLICILCLPLPFSAVCLFALLLFLSYFAFVLHRTLKNFIPRLSPYLSPNLLIPIVFIHYYFP